MHEGAHRTLFRTRWLNDVLTDWLCARPVWSDLHRYRVHHLVHHTKTGTDEDTDISLVTPFPTTRASLARKLLRDLTGITGFKSLYGRFLMDAGVIQWTVASDVRRLPADGRVWHDYVRCALRNMTPMLVTNGILFAILAAAGHAWLYGVWALAYLTTFNVFIRIRSMAEHACTERTTDMLRNTRTTRAGWLARLTVAPFQVNYHMEHHVMISVPYFRLPAMHRLLRERGVVPAAPSYLDVLRMVSARAPTVS
jgi:fatty acid desaturase